jgi:hypothetical protein
VNYLVTYTAFFTRLSDGQEFQEGPATAVVPGPVGPLRNVIGDIGGVPRNQLWLGDYNTGGSTVAAFFSPYTGSYSNIVRQDGLPDNCGNPPPPPAPPWPPTGEPVPTTITYEGDDGDTYIQDGDYFVFSPSINFNGDLVVPITWEPDLGVSLSGTLNVTTGDINFSPDIFRPGRPGGEPDGSPTPPEPPATNPSPDDDPDSALIRAVVVSMDVSGNNRASEIAYQGQPDTFVPRLGVVRFAIAIPGINDAVWTGDIPIKQTFQWIDCPSAYGAVDVVAAPDPGSGNSILSITAIRGPSPFLNPG